MKIFEFRDRLVEDYAAYVKSFIQIRDQRMRDYVNESMSAGVLWPEPLIQLNPSFEQGDRINDLVTAGVLHPECAKIFRVNKSADYEGDPLILRKHQSDAVHVAKTGNNYVLTTGTASGKSLAYIVPIVNFALLQPSKNTIKAIIVYPMNALANSQFGELEKFLCLGYQQGKPPVTFARYTGQESDEQRSQIIQNPPDIILTNYVMLELILTRPYEKKLIEAAQGLRFLVLDELHTYRGRQGADVALLVRRVRERLSAENLQCIGTSATIAGKGSFKEQRAEVAQVASQLFGAEVKPENIIGETLRRATPAHNLNDPIYINALTARVSNPNDDLPVDYERYINDPLSSWLESTFGFATEAGSDRLIRTKPRTISGENGAAHDLHKLTGVSPDDCIRAIRQGLLGAYLCQPNPETNSPPFAFRLHQFISRGDTLHTTLEPEDCRYLTVYGQQFKPGSRSHILLPLVFCRECGQEYYCVRLNIDSHTGVRKYQPRALSDNSDDGDGEAGFLYFSTERSWPSDEQQIHDRVPDDWLEELQGRIRVRFNRKDSLPRAVWVGTDGVEANDGLAYQYISAPFRFCLECGVSYGFRQTDDFSKLTSLGSEGRSTATTILSLSAITHLRHIENLDDIAKKLLSFTDNRQDASLQAGHFNDFIEIALLRSAIYRAVSEAGAEGIPHEDLVPKVFAAFDLPFSSYASDPELKHQARNETKRALREVLGYRIYRDLKRGWRITSPNLEQCGLLAIKYPFLKDVCADEEIWANTHPALVSASPDTRVQIAKVLLDFMRRELAIKVTYLDPDSQERILQLSNQRLKEPWAIDENEAGTMEHATILYPKSRARNDYRGNVYLSSRSGFGLFLRRKNTFPDHSKKLSVEETEIIIRNILESLRLGGLVEKIDEDEAVPGYQVPADAMQWVAGAGTESFHDLIRVPNAPQAGRRTNPFFVQFYRAVGSQLLNMRAREHTAQVDYELRVERENDFRKGLLPILYCSPTMELGVDIAQLNVVNMRNVPPTPANYAQRSGRAGRSGQPALVFTYCSTGSPHDQYFFKHPKLMVAGAVSPPRLDLANEDLIRAHIHAVWLGETGDGHHNMGLGKSLKEILDLYGETPSLELLPSVKAQINDESPRRRARERAERILATIKADLDGCDWYTERWLDEVLRQVARRFDKTCDRWRSLYSSALAQAKTQDGIIRDPNRKPEDRRQAERLRREAEAQLKLLIEVENVAQSDFYSYRYFASEGFLPGYNFPRLPISAYIPGRRTKDEFLSRPRFLAISEFGPRSIIYHEGSRYTINKVIMPVPRETQTAEPDAALPWHRAKICSHCGYLHPISAGNGQDSCERCQSQLDLALQPLFRMQNVSTKRRDRINSDEEERIRLGYEVISGVRFAEHDGRISYRTGTIESDGHNVAKLYFGHSATLWRINLGWRRRKNRNQLGFVLDTERGYWARDEELAQEDQDDPLSARTIRIIPFVEDTRNCLLFEPSENLTQTQMASLQAALKIAIQIEYQLEDNELAAEPLPSIDERRVILFYEAAEGGAGVLRRLLDDSQSFARIAKNALAICHFDPISGKDRRRADHAGEDCEAACYDCLLSYYNQRDHSSLDRQTIRDLLFGLAHSQVVPSPTALPLAEHVAELLRLAGSDLERQWINYLHRHCYRLPSKSQAFSERCQTRPDFIYEDEQTLVYVDGPYHLYPDRQERDRAQTECLEDCGYTVLRFGLEEDWESVIKQYPHVFGVVS